MVQANYNEYASSTYKVIRKVFSICVFFMFLVFAFS